MGVLVREGVGPVSEPSWVGVAPAFTTWHDGLEEPAPLRAPMFMNMTSPRPEGSEATVAVRAVAGADPRAVHPAGQGRLPDPAPGEGAAGGVLVRRPAPRTWRQRPWCEWIDELASPQRAGNILGSPAACPRLAVGTMFDPEDGSGIEVCDGHSRAAAEIGFR